VKIIEFCVFSGKPKTTSDYEMWEFIAFASDYEMWEFIAFDYCGYLHIFKRWQNFEWSF
jgi:hypothetical protein